VRLGLKYAISLLVPLVILTAVLGYAYQRHIQKVLSVELVKEGRAIALVVQAVAEDYKQTRRPDEFTRFVDEVAGYERLLGLRIFGPDGRLVYQPPSLDAYPFRDSLPLQSVLRERRSAETHQVVEGKSVLGFMFPLADRQGNLLGAGQVLQLESFIAADVRSNLNYILALSLAMVVATTTIIYLVTRFSVTRPIATLVGSFRRAGAGDLSARATVRGGDELARLATEFNRMCERLEEAQHSLDAELKMRQQFEGRLRNADRLAGLGRLSAGLAHEIGSPLNVISGRAESLLRHFGDNEQARRSLQDISTQSERIVNIVRDMLDFARMKTPRRAPTSLDEVVHTVLDLAAPQLASGRVSVQVGVPAELPAVVADNDQLQQVFLNLVLNALDAMQGGGTLHIRAAERLSPHPDQGGRPRRCVAIDFEDTGVGIPAENLDRLFDPFFTTKEPGKGTGLGLSVSYGIIEEHGGWFDVDSHPGRGTRMTVYLPLDAESAAGTAAPQETA
jgi:two-component system, NtrC family, sensor kinase